MDYLVIGMSRKKVFDPDDSAVYKDQKQNNVRIVTEQWLVDSTQHPYRMAAWRKYQYSEFAGSALATAQEENYSASNTVQIEYNI